jgi:hypothetical protein
MTQARLSERRRQTQFERRATHRLAQSLFQKREESKLEEGRGTEPPRRERLTLLRGDSALR